MHLGSEKPIKMDYKPEMYSKPETYNKHAAMPITVAELALSKFFNGDQSSESLKNGKVLDVACGEGLVTSILKSKLGKDAKIDACDISPEVLDHAKLKYGLSNVEYFVMDICQPVPLHLKGSYDLLFSNFFMHWTHDHRTVIRNFSVLLRTGGRCIITFIVHQAAFTAYRILAASPTWSKYLVNVERFITPYQDSDSPEDDFEKLLHSYNFTKVEVKCENVTITKSLAYHKVILQNIDPFYQRLPEELRSSYMSDLIRVYTEHGGFCDYNPESDSEDTVNLQCRVLFAFATKNGSSL